MWFTYYIGLLASSGPANNVDGTASASVTVTPAVVGSRGQGITVPVSITPVLVYTGAHNATVTVPVTITPVLTHAGQRFGTVTVSVTVTPVATGVASGANKLLKEDSDFLLLETGDKILLEA